MIIGLFPDLLPVGGVQMAGRQLAAVLTKIARQRGMQTHFISLNDPMGIHTASAAGVEFNFKGFGRSKTKFATEGLRFAKKSPQLILAAHPNLAVPGALIKLRSANQKRAAALIVCSHGVEVWQPLSRLRRSSLKQADQVFAPSSDTARKLSDVQKVDSNKISVLHWGLDPDFVDLAAASEKASRPERMPNGPYILSVGRWAAAERYKGFDTLIRVMPKLIESFPDLQLVFIGEGDDRSFLEKIATEYRVAGRTHFVSGLSRPDLAAAYRHCEVFALPSGGEGFGLVFLEAMALGKPVIGGNHGGTPDIIEDSGTGFLVTHGNKEELEARLRVLLGSESVRVRMGDKGRERVYREFSFAKFSSNFESAVSKLIGNPRTL
jgi:glycosyltransferase involved in cell wall biosynthesis